MAGPVRCTLSRRLAAAFVMAAGIGAVGAPSAYSHAAFVGAEPQAGARLETSPRQVTLSFTEPLNERLSRVELRTAAGERVPLAAQAPSAKRVVLRPREALDTGAYRVKWHTVSTEDGHALEGVFSFGVRAPPAGGGHQVEQSPLARAGWVRVAFRAVLYVTVLLFAAALFIPPLLRLRDRSPGSWVAPDALATDGAVDPSAIEQRERRVMSDLGWLSVGAAVAATLAEAADAAGGLSVNGMRDFLLSSSSGVTRVLVVAALALAALAAPRRRGWAAAYAVTALWAIAASGHASSATPRAPSILNDWVHLVAGAVWLGGIGLLALVLAPTLRRGGHPARQAVARHVLPRFGRVALPAFLVAAATGVVSLLAQLGHIDALWTTTYGRVLAVKIVLVGLIAAASAAHAWLLRPRLLASGHARWSTAERRHWRLVRAEPVAGLAIVVAVALLVAFPLPPRQLGEAGDAVAATPTCSPCPLPAPAPDELAVAAPAGFHVVAGWLRRNGREVRGTIRVLDQQGQPAAVPFAVLAARQEGCGRGCRRFRLNGGDQVRVAVSARGRRDVASLPASWRSESAPAARRVLRRAQHTMRRLRSVRQHEKVTSGPGSFAGTVYTLRAPNRMRFITNLGAATVSIGKRRWARTGDSAWSRVPSWSGSVFSVRRWFRWTTYARSIQILDRRREGNRRVTELALMDPATPVWFLLVVDDRTGRVLRERMTARAHFMRARYEAFNADLAVKAPDER